MNPFRLYCAVLAVLLLALSSCQKPVEVDLVIRNAMIYDGSGGKPYSGAVAIQADTIVQIQAITLGGFNGLNN